MIITRLVGGLGNQLFQYAAGRRLAHRHGVTLKLDVTPFKTYSLRQYGLGDFAINADVASPADIAFFNPDSRVKKLLCRLTGQQMIGNVFFGRDYIFESRLLVAPASLFLVGHWLSEEYFVDIADILRQELTVLSPLAGRNAEIAAEIAASESVSIHVRRGDYVSNPGNAGLYSACTPEYYGRCVAYIAERVRNPRFFVFSDDIEWAAANLSFGHPTTFVGHNGDAASHEDLRLMSLCRHHITANSTFSWWGAWLNPGTDKMVLTPRRWFQSREVENLIPEGWVRI
jgi:hypothetical protein